MNELVDAKARARILSDYESTLFVEAAAGNGKTTVLVGRIVGLIRSGKGTLARIVAVTFTEKAAGEPAGVERQFEMVAHPVRRARRRFPVGASPTRASAPAGSNRSRHGGDEMSEASG